jgi:DNA-binding HxlR family transcriptional regulator
MSNEKPKLVCPVERVIDVIGGKWKIIILFHLMNGTKRFNELRRLMPEVSQRMLTRQLRELEEYDIVERKVYAQVPPKVEYSLTDLGKSLDSILDVLHNWGVENIKMIELKNGKKT